MTWQQIGSDIDGENSLDLSGEAISMSGDGSFIAIGACTCSLSDSNSATDSGVFSDMFC